MGRFRRQGEQPEQCLRRQVRFRQQAQMNPAESSVQRFDFRAGRLGQLLPEVSQSRRLISNKVATTEHTLVQGFEQVLRPEGRIPGTLVQQEFFCLIRHSRRPLSREPSYHSFVLQGKGRRQKNRQTPENPTVSADFFPFFPFSKVLDKFRQDIP